MFSFKTANLRTILVLFILTSLIHCQNSKTSFTIHQIKSETFVKSGSAAVLSTFNKFNKKAPKNIQNAATVDRGTAVALPSLDDGAYVAPVTFGGQTLNLRVDTGSGSLWAYSSDFAAFFPSTYNSSLSKTSKLQEGYTWHSCYGGGICVHGDVYLETVSIGNITVKNQTIGAARSKSLKHFKKPVHAGILGLAFNKKSMGIPRYTPFLDNLKSVLSAPLFTADLKKGKPGSYDFGFIDDNKYTGNINYVPVHTRHGFWGFNLNGFAIGTDNFTPVATKVVADTGASLMLLPEKITSAYYARVPGAVNSTTAAGYIFPCTSTLPNITLKIGTHNAVVPGHFLNFSPLREDNTTCYGGIQSINPGMFILGDVFLKSQFVVFDAGSEPRIGFATKRL